MDNVLHELVEILASRLADEWLRQKRDQFSRRSPKVVVLTKQIRDRQNIHIEKPSRIDTAARHCRINT